MKTYQKMKAVIVDLSDALDEAVAFESYVCGKKIGKKKLAYAHYANSTIPAGDDYAAWAAMEEGDYGQFTKVSLS